LIGSPVLPEVHVLYGVGNTFMQRSARPQNFQPTGQG
jgi:hypothetical protein